MTLRRREVELSVERPLPAEGGGSVRLVARFETTGEEAPSSRDLASALDGLRADLDALVGPPIAAAGIVRPAREVGELVNAYRPRQRELVDLLREEGEISEVEHARLVDYLGSVENAPRPIAAAPRPSLDDRPIAAAPIVAEPSGDGARPVAQLLQTYRIESLKQAGAVRARRQISFAEYMALKRHFEGEASGSAPTA